MKTFHRKEEGQGLVEFVFVLPALLLLVFGMFIIGQLSFYLVNVHNAAREGGRTSSTWNPSQGGSCLEAVNIAVQNASYPYLDVVASDNCDSLGTYIPYGEEVKIVVSMTYEPPFFSTFLNPEFPITIPLWSTSTFRHQN